MKKNRKKALWIGIYCLFGVYLILLTYFLFFAESTGRTTTDQTYHYNLTLFKEIKRFWHYRHSLGMKAVVVNLAGNVLAFVPFGALLPMLHRRWRSFLKMVILTLCFSLVIELIQLMCKVGSFDVDDLLLNTIGGALGYLAFVVLYSIRRKRYEKASKLS